MEEKFDQDYSNIVGSSAAVTATLQGNRIINLRRKVRDINNNTTKTFSCPYICNDTSIKPLLAPVEVAKRVIDCNSLSGLLNIKFNETGSTGSKDLKCVIEVTRDISLEKIIDVSGVHGKVISDGWFGSSGCNYFSCDEKYFVYVAVPTPAKTTSYFDTTSSPDSPSSRQDEPLFPTKYDYKEDWGEKYTGVAELGLYVLNIESGKVLRIPDIPPGVTAGQPVFTPCGRGVVYTAWNTEPKRLGMIYCYQRPCSLRLVSIGKLLDALDPPTDDSDIDQNNDSAPTADTQGTTIGTGTGAGTGAGASRSKPAPLSCPHVCLTPHLQQARYAQFSSSEASSSSSSSSSSEETTRLVFLGHEQGFDTHNASSGLYALNWTELLLTAGPDLWEPGKRGPATLPTEKLTEAVIEPASPTMANSATVLVNNFHFPGLFASAIAPCSFISPKMLLLETNWRAVAVVLVVNIETCELRVLSMQDSTSFHLSNVFYSSYTVKKHISHLGEQTSACVEYASPVGLSASRASESSWQSPTPYSISLLCVAGGLEGGVVLITSNTSSRPRLGFISADELMPLLVPSKMSGLISLIPFTAQGKKLKSTFSDVFPLMALSASAASGCGAAEGLAMAEDAMDNMESYLVQARAADDHSKLVESVLLFPSRDFPGEGIPLMVVPHGGPHSQFTTAYMSPYAYLALTLNMAVLMVNYRGSTGYGQAELNALPGRIGVVDVSDMHTATLAALEVNDMRLDSSRICVAGGSHGGFLTGHLLGQYPSLFRAGALRNPVINVPCMATVSDITDWCIVEACGIKGSEFGSSKPEALYNFTSYETPNSTQLAKMYNCSPIRHVQNVTAPVLMLLGAKDRRVPVSQGLEFFHTLRRVPDRLAGNIPTEMRLYPEADHAIDIPDSEADQFISMKKWFAKYV